MNSPLLKLIIPKRYDDSRGFFSEIYNRKNYKNMGINDDFLQDNHSLSNKTGTLRGLHFQSPPFAQGKLVRCGRGAIFDVAVDIRRGSPTYGCWEGYELTDKNGHQLYIPVGFAHGFLTLEDHSEIVYRCTNYYAPHTEVSIHWDSCGIDWPVSDFPILSEKDQQATLFKHLNSPFVYGENS